ncbi:mitochondrial tRNA methylthiotransferase CDK5RAP1 isoform X2 [Heteronotia binoei]|uniref:mitochondrial tRNA methylthiotransferase CDK5RAP1 isoform X1 n=1 Tax=Heteronotia binoei TaxID=13085 RepID=UPI00292D3D49|nr:mitochondrial tRNA methylthiotransferase CDK5RAP1 isoform X1 [Heteronotia binoei]XP_060086471.1 mitochondrial tRNA methylthiotransferase CDK5RAP1 isoform X1 [Heteronotia binoei]XP_060086478.1 mitochondrial tRNA methylthiotransferase CDK5RAP1 isoform X2 [Heteronotia binoei]
MQPFHCLLGGTRLLHRRPAGWTLQLALRTWSSACCSPDSGAHAKEAKQMGGGLEALRAKLATGPAMQHFLQGAAAAQESCRLPDDAEEDADHYLGASALAKVPRKVYLETYGCQMNVNDTEIAWSILQRSGYLRTSSLQEADVVLLVTCSIREKAERTIWNRLQHLITLKSKRSSSRVPLRIGILGCMAERLKEKILDQEKMVDVVAGPDAYRDLPRLLAVADTGQQAANVLLSLDETYADVLPVQNSTSSTSAFVSIMRGCDNMCSYCIVPFTRGRERSRPIASILQEVQLLSDQGVKEVTLLGQNVNSYRDTSEVEFLSAAPAPLSRGFSTNYKPKLGGLRFAALLDRVSLVDPEMRIRFTSPHPKDFPDEVFQLMRERPNLCKHIHLPAQSGSTRVLEAMRRGYTREAYLELVHHIRASLPGVNFSSDFIAGFCGETEADHQQTVSLLRQVRYNGAFIFAYSMRQKTRAFHRLQDDVPSEVKLRRLRELMAVFREEAAAVNAAAVGRAQVVLVEGPSRRSPSDLCGRNDGNIKVIFPDVEMDDGSGLGSTAKAKPGDYVLVKISSANSQTLKGVPLRRTTLREAAAFSEC